jgi:acetyl esterase/lipase
MAKELWYFLAGMMVIAVPLAILVAVKKLDLFEDRPDAKLAYTQAGGNTLYLHAFHAGGAGDKAPALLLLHGGAWRFGGPQQFYPQCRFFAARGYRCFSAEYRLGPHDPPDIRGAIEDAAQALEYLLDNADALGIDPTRIYVGGGSAGGHLAASLGAGLHGAGRPLPTALALLNPVLDLAPCTPFNHLAGVQWQSISPRQSVGPDYPPTLILSGALDVEVTPDSIAEFCDALREQGVHCESVIYEGQRHGFFNPGNNGGEYLRRTSERIADFLAQVSSR